MLLMFVSLFTSREVLAALGIDDYGIYNVVGGVVAMFSILSGAISASISRFITFELGCNNSFKLKQVFCTSVNIQLILSLIILIVGEPLGLWFLYSQMNIPPERLTAANWVFQCSLLTFIINLISIPYNAAIIAHEKMPAFAYISIFEAIMKLIIVYFLYVTSNDRLVLYAIFLMIVAVIQRLIYSIYCKKQFEECSYHLIWDKETFRSMIGFSSWNYVGSIAGLCRSQGINIVLNIFCGPTVNAARGIANQVNGTVHGFVTNFMAAVNPQITKSYASGNTEYMIKLIFTSSKLSFFLLLVLSMPIMIEADTILGIWLKDVPDHTTLFVQLVLIFAMWEELANPLITAALAYGSIKKYQVTVGLLNLMNLPISYFFLRLGYFPEITMIVAILFAHICIFARVVLLRDMINIPVRVYFTEVYLRAWVVFIISALLALLFHCLLNHGTLQSLIVMIITTLSTCLIVFFIGCNDSEKIFAIKKIRAVIDKVTNK